MSIDCGQCPTVRPRAPQVGLEVGPERAGQDVDREALVVDVDHAGHRREVEQHAAVARDAGPAHAAAAAGGGDGHAVLVAHAEHGGHLAGVGRPAHHRRQRAHLPVERPVHGQRPPVPAGLGPGGRVGRRGRAGGDQRLAHRGIERCRLRQARTHVLGRPGELDGRGGCGHSGSEGRVQRLIAGIVAGRDLVLDRTAVGGRPRAPRPRRSSRARERAVGPPSAPTARWRPGRSRRARVRRDRTSSTEQAIS